MVDLLLATVTTVAYIDPTTLVFFLFSALLREPQCSRRKNVH